MLLPYVLTSQLTIRLNTVVTSVKRNGRTLTSVTYKNTVTGKEEMATAPYFIDATEAGDLLPLAGVDYVTGAEAKAETHEPHALEVADPNDIQAFHICTWDGIPTRRKSYDTEARDVRVLERISSSYMAR